jgi:hypothetical protein
LRGGGIGGKGKKEGILGKGKNNEKLLFGPYAHTTTFKSLYPH